MSKECKASDHPEYIHAWLMKFMDHKVDGKNFHDLCVEMLDEHKSDESGCLICLILSGVTTYRHLMDSKIIGAKK